MLAGLAPDDQPDFGSGSIAERHRQAAIGLHGRSVVYSDKPANFSATSAVVPRTVTLRWSSKQILTLKRTNI
jgi:hypothetical protein